MSDRLSAGAPDALEFRGWGGLRLQGDAWGKPQNRPVLFLHGGGQTRHSWGKTATVLAEQGWYAVSLDLRGHGDSDWDDARDYRIEAFVEDVAGIIREIGPPAVLVGASLGGITSLLLTGEFYPELSAGLVLVDVTPRLEKTGVERILNFMRGGHEGFDSYEEAAEAIASYNPHRDYKKDITGLERVLRRKDDGRLYWHWDPDVIHEDFIFQEADYGRFRDAAKNVKVPTLLVRGKETDVVSVAGAHEFLEYVPHAEFVDVTGAGHMVAGDRNDAFSEAVVNFLQKFPPPDTARS